MECQKLKFKANCNKNWANLIKYESCTSSIFYAFYDPTSLKYQLKNVNLFMKKVIPRSVRLSWSAEKSNVEQTILKFGKSRLKYASFTSSR